MAPAAVRPKQRLIATSKGAHSKIMETRSNQILVGGIVLALLGALVGFAIWLAGIGGGIKKDYDIFFSPIG